MVLRVHESCLQMYVIYLGYFVRLGLIGDDVIMQNYFWSSYDVDCILQIQLFMDVCRSRPSIDFCLTKTMAWRHHNTLQNPNPLMESSGKPFSVALRICSKVSDIKILSDIMTNPIMQLIVFLFNDVSSCFSFLLVLNCQPLDQGSLIQIPHSPNQCLEYKKGFKAFR